MYRVKLNLEQQGRYCVTSPIVCAALAAADDGGSGAVATKVFKVRHLSHGFVILVSDPVCPATLPCTDLARSQHPGNCPFAKAMVPRFPGRRTSKQKRVLVAHQTRMIVSL